MKLLTEQPRRPVLLSSPWAQRPMATRHRTVNIVLFAATMLLVGLPPATLLTGQPLLFLAVAMTTAAGVWLARSFMLATTAVTADGVVAYGTTYAAGHIETACLETVDGASFVRVVLHDGRWVTTQPADPDWLAAVWDSATRAAGRRGKPRTLRGWVMLCRWGLLCAWAVSCTATTWVFSSY